MKICRESRGQPSPNAPRGKHTNHVPTVPECLPTGSCVSSSPVTCVREAPGSFTLLSVKLLRSWGKAKRAEVAA